MHRLRHPIRSITEPYGKAGLLVAILALVLATTGAAFAAGKLTSTQKKEVVKIAKKYAGKPGPAGPAGTNGANGEKGAQGLQGEKGEKGEKGDQGIQGIQGNPGTSVTNAPVPSGSGETKCNHRGGAEFKVGSGTATFACNGEPGVIHPGETLPGGATETGSFAVFASGFGFGSLPFPIPLAHKLDNASECNQTGKPACVVDYVTIAEQTGGTAPAQCQGTAEEPTAASGTLCVYEGVSSGSPTVRVTAPANGGLENGHAGKAGAVMAASGSPAYVLGSFAVTG